MFSGGPQQRLARRFFVIGLVLTALVFFYMIRLFLVPILLAAVFATLFYPVYFQLLRFFRRRRAPAALVCCLLLLLGLLLPIYFVAGVVATEGLDLYRGVETKVRDVLERPEAAFLQDARQTAWFQKLGLDRLDWHQALRDSAQTVGNLLTDFLSQTSKSTLQVLVTLLVTFFTMFYFFVDGAKLVAQLKYLSPLADEHERAIIDRFVSVARATVRGNFLIALIQGTLGGLTLWAFGVNAPILWGVVMVLLAFIPLIGVKMVLLPTALFLILTGDVGRGIGILIVSFVVILNVDNFLRPRLVAKRARMHDLLILFATLGGLATFGAAGIIIGPVIAAFFVSLVEIYSEEFRQELEANPVEVERAAASAAGTDSHRG